MYRLLFHIHSNHNQHKIISEYCSITNVFILTIAANQCPAGLGLL